MANDLTGDEALKRLMAGNAGYAALKSTHPNQTSERRIELKKGQHPFCIILGCSDSRIPPEVIFDQGLGDLFVIRVAGNITGTNVLASIEYAAAHLHVPLLVVLGHSDCGAVKATVAGQVLEGHLPSLAAAIEPAVNRLKGQPGDGVDDIAKANARLVSEQLRQSTPVLSKLVQDGSLRVVAAFYDLDSGLVDLLT